MKLTRYLLKFIAALLLAQAQTSSHAADAPNSNIVFIFADNWGWGDLSCHGHP